MRLVLEVLETAPGPGAVRVELRGESGIGGSLLAAATVTVSRQSLASLTAMLRELNREIAQRFREGQSPALLGDQTGPLMREIGRAMWRMFMLDGTAPNLVGRTLRDLYVTPGGLQPRLLHIVAGNAQAHDLLRLPWELLYDDGLAAGAFVIYGAGLAVSRCVPDTQARPPCAFPISIKPFLVAPSDLVPFNTLWCQRQIDRWQDVYGPYAQFAPTSIDPTPEEFLDAFTQYDVIYFMGHSEAADAAHRPGLYLTDGGRGTTFLAGRLLDADDLAERCVHGDTVTRLLVLSGCNSIDTALRIFLGQDTGMRPMVVAMQFLWPIACALSFQEVLFDSLLFGELGLVTAVGRWRTADRDPALGMDRASGLWAIPTVLVPGGGPPGPQQYALTESFVRVEGGTAELGLDDGQAALVRGLVAHLAPIEQSMLSAVPCNPHHTTELRPFLIERCPVTKHLYRWFCDNVDTDAKVHYPLLNPDGDAAAPARVSFEGAEHFCRRMSEETGNDWRLPTCDEWEWAARGRKSTILPWCENDTEAEILALIGRLAAEPLCSVRESLRPDDGAEASSVFRCRDGAEGGPIAVDMIGNVPEYATSAQGPRVSGWGAEWPLLMNLPSLWHAPQAAAHGFAFRRVWVLPD